MSAEAAGQAFQSSRWSINLERASTGWYSRFCVSVASATATGVNHGSAADLANCQHLSQISKAVCSQIPKARCPIWWFSRAATLWWVMVRQDLPRPLLLWTHALNTVALAGARPHMSNLHGPPGPFVSAHCWFFMTCASMIRSVFAPGSPEEPARQPTRTAIAFSLCFTGPFQAQPFPSILRLLWPELRQYCSCDALSWLAKTAYYSCRIGYSSDGCTSVTSKCHSLSSDRPLRYSA